MTRFEHATDSLDVYMYVQRMRWRGEKRDEEEGEMEEKKVR